MEFLQHNWYWAALAAASGTWLMVELVRSRGDDTQLSPVEATLLINREDALLMTVEDFRDPACAARVDALERALDTA